MTVETVWDALGLKRGDVVAVTGGGGKTTLIGQLTREARASGGRVVVTATTRFTLPAEPELPVVVAGSRAGMFAATLRALESSSAVVVAGGFADKGRHTGIPSEWIPDLAAMAGVTLTIVNADGSAMRPFKAPAEHEPAVPPSVSVVVAVAGLDVLGRPLDGRWVHRPERVAEVAGMQQGALIDEGVMLRVLSSEQGGRKNVPAGARYAVVLNKADAPDLLAAGTCIAYGLRSAGVSRVVLTALRSPAPLRAVLAA